MKQSRVLPPVFGLPDEILEEIVAELDQHKDLISFALASRLCSTLVIPHHTEYRILRVRHPLPDMWAHLARRADLARNVRQVHICERSNYLSPDHYPTTLIDKSIDNALINAEESVRIRNICQALAHMHRLQVFNWSCKDLPGQQRPTSHPNHENAVLTAVSQLPALQTLNLSGKFALHALSSQIDTCSMTYPVWKVTNLTSLSLYGQSWAKLTNSKHLCHLLAKSPNLEYLVLPLEFHHLADCHFPKLKKLKLIMQSGVSTGIDDSRGRFLQNHPTIEELNWLPIGIPNLGPDCLPNLRILRTNRQFMVSLDDPESVSPPTGLLSPPCSPVTAAPAPVSVEPTVVPQKPRPIESLDVYSLDAQTLLELRCVHKKTLRKLKLHSFGDMSILHELAAQFPNIEWLCLPSVHLPTDALHPVLITKDDWLDLLPRFPNLQVFRGDGLWRAVKGKKNSSCMKCSWKLC